LQRRGGIFEAPNSFIGIPHFSILINTRIGCFKNLWGIFGISRNLGSSGLEIRRDSRHKKGLVEGRNSRVDEPFKGPFLID
jgi:hypothetical protein